MKVVKKRTGERKKESIENGGREGREVFARRENLGGKWKRNIKMGKI